MECNISKSLSRDSLELDQAHFFYILAQISVKFTVALSLCLA